MAPVTRRSARTALDAALSALSEQPTDEAIVHLARHYARLLDNAAPAGKYAKAVAWIERLDCTAAQEQLRLTVLVALAEHSVASDLGPKYLAVLDALGMTPLARARLAGKVQAPAEAHKSPLDELAARRREMLGG